MVYPSAPGVRHMSGDVCLVHAPSFLATSPSLRVISDLRFRVASFFLGTLQDTHLSWGDKTYTRAFMCSPRSGVLVRNELFLVENVPRVQQSLPFF